MFTGIVDHCGTILDIVPLDTGIALLIQSDFVDLQLGESIAVDGICLTVTKIENATFSVELSMETLAVTTAKQFKKHQHINLERALRPMDRMGGHFVAGHVDQVADVKKINQQDDFCDIEIVGVSAQYQKYLSKKGSITVNGVSLTINALIDDGFVLMLIPHTLERTNLKTLSVGSLVNLEFDLMAKLVAVQLENVNARQ